MKWHILLCRHGHRAPTATLVPNDIGHSFNAAWQELAVSHSDPILSPLNKYYPVVNSPVNKAPNDAKHYPFGSLTYIGAEHMYNVGKGLGEAFPQLRQVPLDEYSVTATNYQRTQVIRDNLAFYSRRNFAYLITHFHREALNFF